MEVIAKKTVNQIQSGDVIGRSHENCFAYSGSPVVKTFLTVTSVVKSDNINNDGQRIGKRYDLTCSDGKTYSTSSGRLQYLIFAEEVK
jgi:hypothetical protein